MNRLFQAISGELIISQKNSQVCSSGQVAERFKIQQAIRNSVRGILIEHSIKRRQMYSRKDNYKWGQLTEGHRQNYKNEKATLKRQVKWRQQKIISVT